MTSNELDPDLIAPGATQSNITVDKTFEVPENHYNPQGLNPKEQTVSDGPLGAQIPGQLPNVDIDFKIVDDQKTKIINFQEVESVLLTNKTLSQETVQLIEAKMPGFLSEPSDLRQYTKLPSTVGYSKAVQYVKKQIATESETLYQNLGSMIKQYYLDEARQLDSFIADRLNSLVYQIEIFTSDMTDVYDKVKSSPNTQYADSDGLFKNLFKDEFETLKTANAKQDGSATVEKYQLMIKTTKSVISILEKGSMSSFIGLLLNNQADPKNYYDSKAYTAVQTMHMSFYDLLEIIFTSKFKTFVNDVFTYYTEYNNTHQTVVNKIHDLSNQDSVNMTLWFLENETAVKALINNIHRLNALTVLIPSLLLAVKTACETLTTVN